MKLLAALLLIGVTSAPALAGGLRTGYRSSGGYAEEMKCYRKEYREEYIPGTAKNPGYVKRYRKRVEVNCPRQYRRPKPEVYHEQHYYMEPHPNVGRIDDNSCVEGTVAGGLLGGALGGVLSKKENWIWAIPTGMVGGAMVGCQVDGG